jgi:uncharacterized membrane protein/nitrite reductase/ring-hydroxylating ferredoxin subunit
MKSRANIKTHPIHPILVAFPIAFFTGSWLCTVAGIWFDYAILRNMSLYLALGGVAFGFLAAIFGIIDYVYTIPPASSAKTRGAKHGIINTFVLILFITSLITQTNTDLTVWPTIAIRTAGIILMTIAGWLGGTLVYRNQIGVDIRYANAGKWKEIHVPNPGAMKSGVEVAHSADIGLNQMMLVHLGGKRVVVARSEKGVAAFDDRCTHKGGSLAGGSMICGTVQCPWHGSQFNVHTGEHVCGPAEKDIDTYRTEEKNGKIYLYL